MVIETLLNARYGILHAGPVIELNLVPDGFQHHGLLFQLFVLAFECRVLVVHALKQSRLCRVAPLGWDANHAVDDAPEFADCR